MPDESRATSEHSTNPHAIARIVVEKLFGQFTYQLPLKHRSNPDLSNLLILYGDNGSGKTTILRLLFHLLSPEDGKGHKSEVAKVRFRRFAVELTDGTTIKALRLGESQVGVYRAAILKGSETIDAIDFPSDSRSHGEVTDEMRGRVRSFLDKLQNFGLALHFLPDDRRILGREYDIEFEKRRRRIVTSTGTLIFNSTPDDDSSPGSTLKWAVDRAASWIRQQALTGSNRGQRGVHSIYTDITKHIVESSQTQVLSSAAQGVEELVEKLKSVSERSEAYSQFGLTSELPVDQIIASLEQAAPETKPIWYNVMRPYVQSIDARLNALEGIHTLVQNFVRNINGFFGDTKQVSYDIRRGFAITSKGGDLLSLEMLSSGERQLLLLMCNTLAARDQASILIIDEPEISLNVKWQRRLVQALLDCIKGSNAQLIFATHSIELLSKHRGHVVRLIDLTNGEKTGRVKDESNEPRRTADDRRVDSEV